MEREGRFGHEGNAQLVLGVPGVQGVAGGDTGENEENVKVAGGEMEDLADIEIGFAKAIVGGESDADIVEVDEVEDGELNIGEERLLSGEAILMHRTCGRSFVCYSERKRLV